MPTSTPSPSQGAANAAVVIRERIKEKRLYEARFLFGLLDDDDMPRQERLALERELEGLLAVVRELRDEADRYQAAGESAPAERMRREMERIAVDVPDPARQNGARSVAAGRLLREAEQAGPASERGRDRRRGARRNHRKLPLDVRFSQWLDKRRGRRAVTAAAQRVAVTEATETSTAASTQKRRRGGKGFSADRAVALCLCVLAVAAGLYLLARQDATPSGLRHADAAQTPPPSSISIGALVEEEGSGDRERTLGAQSDTEGRVFP